MGDPAATAAPPQGAAPPPPAAPPARKGLVARATAFVGRRAGLALGAIVVLAVLAAGLYVYYRGFWFLGPFAGAAGARGGRAGLPAKGSAPGGAGEGEADAETEKLIRAINTAP